MVRLVIFGRQGAGKGTQSTRLAERYGAPHISTGDLLREAVTEGTPVGLEAKAYMDAGKLLPDAVMLGVVEERFDRDDVRANGFLLDGFPRTVPQADALLGITPIDLAIDLDVPEDVVLERLSGRRVCQGCGKIYSVEVPPSQPWTCDVCGGNVVQRADDAPDAIAQRLLAYKEQTVPTVEWFGERGLLVSVDGLGSPDDVFARLVAAVSGRLEP
jgi:adenylate kinase